MSKRRHRQPSAPRPHRAPTRGVPPVAAGVATTNPFALSQIERKGRDNPALAGARDIHSGAAFPPVWGM